MKYSIGSVEITCASEAVEALLPAFESRFAEQEGFAVLCLTARHCVIGKPVLVSLGTATEVTVHPRDVFREAIRRNAVAVLVGHNHPSGRLEPSASDVELTHRLVLVGELLGIPVLDHLIVGARGEHVSLRERGELK
jgi:DNA repair protein RadC